MRKLIAVVSATLALLTTASVATQAEPLSGSLEVVALGDSYASGTGAGDYYPGTEGVCWRSKNSYSELTIQELRSHGVHVSFTNATC
ncbi:MAG TPA: hypothetical protein VFT59_03550, partial [Candidatus Saccharimonadales bacterium]|nr:hypothetical protein [Candidatus Saccharimonadales bacterium]